MLFDPIPFQDLNKYTMYNYGENDFNSKVSWQECSNSKQQSEFDMKLSLHWDRAMSEGYFRYTLDNTETRFVPGKRQYVLRLNPMRIKQRRTPEHIKSIKKPFDHEGFNFTKIKSEEILFYLNCTDDISADNTVADILNDVKQCGKESEAEECETTLDRTKANKTNTQTAADEMSSDKLTNGTSRLDKEMHCDKGSNDINTIKETIPYGFSSSTQQKLMKHLVAINVSPLEYGHVLILPDVNSCIPQVITLNGLKVALDVLLLSNHPGFRIGFNGLCALASVNHQHFHAWYLNHPISIQTLKGDLVCEGFYQLSKESPTQGFIFQLKNFTRSQFIQLVFIAADYLQRNEIAHNFCLTRGVALDDPEDCTVRAYLWPRKPYQQLKTSQETWFYSAFTELSGHIPMYEKSKFISITEDYIDKQLASEMLPSEKFNHIRDDIADRVTLFLSTHRTS